MGSRKGRNASQKRRIKKKLMGSGQRAPCAGCGKFFTDEELTIDHKIPISKGGTWHFQNLQLMCYKCNQNKGNTWDLEEIFNEIKEKRTREDREDRRNVDETSNSIDKSESKE